MVSNLFNIVLRIHGPGILLFNPWIIHALFVPFCVTWHMDDSIVINEPYAKYIYP